MGLLNTLLLGRSASENDSIVYKVLLIDNNRKKNHVIDITNLAREKRWRMSRDEVSALCPKMKDWRVEVRYVDRHRRKYRAVFYNEDVVMPIYSAEDLAGKMTPRLTKDYPLSACIARAGDVHGKMGADVTEHVQKYCGPMRNWYRDKGMSIMDHPNHMFVSDDPTTMTRHYPYLHMCTVSGMVSREIAA